MNKDGLTTKELSVIISKQDDALLKAIHKIEYGRHEWTIFMENGQPVRIEQREGARSIKL